MSSAPDEGRPRPVVHVVAGVLLDAAGNVLLAQRPKAKHLAGGWEFPGGKIEPGETRIAGLGRELAEEIGVELRTAHPLIRVRHAYPTRDIDLDVWMVTGFEGVPHGREGQPVRWCPRGQLQAAGLIPADRPVVTALILPAVIGAAGGDHYVVGGADAGGVADGGRAVPARDSRLAGAFCADAVEAAAAVAGGADFLLVTRVLTGREIEGFTAAVNVPVYVREVTLAEAWERGASGVHTLAIREGVCST